MGKFLDKGPKISSPYMTILVGPWQRLDVHAWRAFRYENVLRHHCMYALQLDLMKEGPVIQGYLTAITGQSTVSDACRSGKLWGINHRQLC